MSFSARCVFRHAAAIAGLCFLGVFVEPLRLGASEQRQTAIVKAVQQTSPSVVNIHGQKVLPVSAASTDGTRRVNGMGTGVVIDERGYVLTNYHVVEGVSRIQATLADGRETSAQLVANDPTTDLAVIRIPVEGHLPVISMGTSSDLMTGESVIAIGNAYGYDHTVTRGIISALHRTVQVTDDQKYDDLIQTDASINPGNSGGPLLNIDGETVGINVAVRVGAQGIGFAIPIDKALDVAATLLTVERVDRHWHGVTGETRFGAESSFHVVSVAPESPASRSGLAAGDVITKVGKLPVQRGLDFERGLIHRRVGEEVPLTVQRGKETVQLVIALENMPRGGKPSVDRSWEVLGLRLEPIPQEQFRRLNTRYRGGLKVVAARTDGPAASQGIRAGDVLVGMHIWETISLENVSYIVSRTDLAEIQPLKFYILRGEETLYGHLRVAGKP